LGTGAEFKHQQARFSLKGFLIVYGFNHTLLMDQAESSMLFFLKFLMMQQVTAGAHGRNSQTFV
jgi:hypothetical protein